MYAHPWNWDHCQSRFHICFNQTGLQQCSACQSASIYHSATTTCPECGSTTHQRSATSRNIGATRPALVTRPETHHLQTVCSVAPGAHWQLSSLHVQHCHHHCKHFVKSPAQICQHSPLKVTHNSPQVRWMCFLHARPKEWNTLPCEIQDLKAFLFGLVYNVQHQCVLPLVT